MQHAAVETVGCRREADHLEFRIDGGEFVEETAVHRRRGGRDQVRLVDEYQVAMADFRSAAMHGLDARKENTGVRLASAKPSRIDSGRGLGPQPDHLGMVLGDQLT